MRPVLIQFKLPVFGDVAFTAYFTLLTLGFALAIYLTLREAKGLKMDYERLLDHDLWMVVWGIIGARVLHLVADGHFHDYVNLCTNSKLVPAIDARTNACTSAAQCGYDYLCDLATHKCYPPTDCFAWLKVWRGGLAYYGGFLFAVGFAIYYTRRHALGWWRTADLSSPGIALGLFFGRLGCFLNGCCWGKVTQGSLGVVFPRGGAAWRSQVDMHLISEAQNTLPVHATQLYESIACLAIFVILYYVVRPTRRHFGDVFAWLLILYAIARSVIEIWRDDDRGVFFGGYISTSQLISIPLFLGGLGVLIYLRRRADPKTVG